MCKTAHLTNGFGSQSLVLAVHLIVKINCRNDAIQILFGIRSITGFFILLKI